MNKNEKEIVYTIEREYKGTYTLEEMITKIVQSHNNIEDKKEIDAGCTKSA